MKAQGKSARAVGTFINDLIAIGLSALRKKAPKEDLDSQTYRHNLFISDLDSQKARQDQ